MTPTQPIPQLPQNITHHLANAICVLVDIEDELSELEQLQVLDKIAQSISYRTDFAARMAREKGATWEQVGTAMEMTKQAAQQRFSPRSLFPLR